MILAACSVMNANGQMIDTARFNHNEQMMQKAGTELIKASTNHIGGTVCMILGGALATVGAANNQSAATTFGGILFVAGFIIDLNAWSHISNAGIKLENTGITVPIPNRKSRKKQH